MKQKAVEVLAKLGVGKEEISKLYDEAKEFLSQSGMQGEELDKFAFNHVIGKFHKHKRMLEDGSYTQFESLIIADGRVTDYGAKRKYEKRLQSYKEVDENQKQKMVTDGVVKIEKDGTIIPLWDTTFRKGEPINYLASTVKEIIGITKQKDRMIKTVIKIPHNFIDINIPVGYPVKFFATKNSKSTVDEFSLLLNKTIEPPFQISGEKQDVNSIVKSVFPNDWIEVDNFQSWCSNHIDKRGVWINCLVFSGDSPRQVMLAKDAFLGEGTIEMWADTQQKFIEGAPATVYCDVYKDKQSGLWKGNIVTLYIDEKYKIPEIKSVATEPEPDYVGIKTESKEKFKVWEDESGW